MAIGTKDDFKLHNALALGSYLEELKQNSDIFNGASNGAIRMTSDGLIGDFSEEDFIKEMSSAKVIKHRDPSALGAITPEKFEEDTKISPKLNTYAYLSQTWDAFKKKGQSAEQFSVLVGKAVAMAQIEWSCNTALAGVTGAISVNASMVLGDGTADIKYTDFPLIMGKFGDQLGSIKLLVMTGATYYNLMGTAVAEKLTNIAGATIMSASNPTFGIPVLVTDSPSLGATAGFNILCLADGAVTLINSEEVSMSTGVVRGKENLVLETQYEMATNIDVKGFGLSTAGIAIISPTTAQLQAKANWKQSATDIKNTAGVIFNTKS